MRFPGNRIIGYTIVVIGIMTFLGVIGLGALIGPFIFAAIGVYFLKKEHKWLGYFCLILAALMLVGNVFEAVFRIPIGGILIAALFIYFGYRLVKGKSNPDLDDIAPKKRSRGVKKEDIRDNNDWIDEEVEKLNEEQKINEDSHTDGPDIRIKSPEFRGSLIGDLRLINHRFELKDMSLSYGIGDNKIDLSKAIIPEGESTIVISGLIGDVDIYVPYDLDVSVSASVTIGNLEVLGYKQGGLNRQINLETKGYDQAVRKVKIAVSIFVGDIDVRFL
ncbi:lia operon protein LiaF [Scopulibacillus darangshiensis]|uniref:Lia operon protein LiaF n=1 Tax=Scopulibacillus darangshiensis TaxID=442528 RepID=A0A4R2NC15_9BACL|nr:cell wall-active antibiotics response protein LiaF [Scopulibacillus darangshiensis]TCP18630.1 lia operon protein LiaF [Scopulibacillus darangshiensis]